MNLLLFSVIVCLLLKSRITSVNLVLVRSCYLVRSETELFSAKIREWRCIHLFFHVRECGTSCGWCARERRRETFRFSRFVFVHISNKTRL